MNRIRIWIMATALIAVIASAAGLALAHELSGDAEVRISARRLDDGRTEFALQQRTDGEWGERILPSSRYFPGNPSSDRWLNSSPLTIATVAADSGSAADDGAATEALATAQAEAAKLREALAKAEADLAEATAPPKIVRELGSATYEGGRYTTEVTTHSRGDGQQSWLATYLHIQADGDYGLGDTPAMLRLGCNGGWREIVFFSMGLRPYSNEWGNSVYLVSYEFEAGPVDEATTVRQQEWGSYMEGRSGGYVARPEAMARFFHLLRQSQSLTVHFKGTAIGPVPTDGTVELSFDLEGVFDTPVQPNIDHCGDYYH